MANFRYFQEYINSKKPFDIYVLLIRMAHGISLDKNQLFIRNFRDFGDAIACIVPQYIVKYLGRALII